MWRFIKNSALACRIRNERYSSSECSFFSSRETHRGMAAYEMSSRQTTTDNSIEYVSLNRNKQFRMPPYGNPWIGGVIFQTDYLSVIYLRTIREAVWMRREEHFWHEKEHRHLNVLWNWIYVKNVKHQHASDSTSNIEAAAATTTTAKSEWLRYLIGSQCFVNRFATSQFGYGCCEKWHVLNGIGNLTYFYVKTAITASTKSSAAF